MHLFGGFVNRAEQMLLAPSVDRFARPLLGSKQTTAAAGAMTVGLAGA